MSNNNSKKIKDLKSGFIIPLKKTIDGKLENDGEQTVLFTSQKNQINMGPQNNGEKYIVKFVGGKTILSIDNSDKLFDFLTDSPAEKIELELKNVEVDSLNNLTFDMLSKDGKVESIKFYPREIVVTSSDKSVKKIPTAQLDTELPSNFFDLIENNLISAKALPAQMFDALPNLKTLSVKDFKLGNKTYHFAKTKSEDPDLYIVSGTRLLKFKTKDIYTHQPTENGKEGFFGIITNEKGTAGLGISDITQTQIKSLVTFISNKNTQELKQLTDEQYAAQIINAKQVTAQREKSKSVVSQTKKSQEQEQNLEDLKISEEFDDKTKASSKIVVSNENNATSEQNQQQQTQKEQADAQNKANQEKEKEEEETKQKQQNASTMTDEEEEKTDDTKKPQKEESQKTAAAAPATEKKKDAKKEDFTYGVRLIGMAMFLFGIFGGFGGILLQIIALGITNSSYTFGKKMALPYVDTKDKNVSDFSKIDLSKQGDIKKQSKYVDQLVKQNIISKEFGKQLKDAFDKLEENTAGKVRGKFSFYNKEKGAIKSFEDAIETQLADEQKILDDIQTKIKNSKEPSNLNKTYDKIMKEKEIQGANLYLSERDKLILLEHAQITKMDELKAIRKDLKDEFEPLKKEMESALLGLQDYLTLVDDNNKSKKPAEIEKDLRNFRTELASVVVEVGDLEKKKKEEESKDKVVQTEIDRLSNEIKILKAKEKNLEVMIQDQETEFAKSQQRLKQIKESEQKHLESKYLESLAKKSTSKLKQMFDRFKEKALIQIKEEDGKNYTSNERKTEKNLGKFEDFTL